MKFKRYMIITVLMTILSVFIYANAIFKAIDDNDVTTFRNLALNETSLKVRDVKGWSPLMRAIKKKRFSIVVILLEKKVDLIIEYKYYALSITALHFAAMNKVPAILRLLCKKSRAVDYTDNHGNTPLIYAIRSGDIESVKILIEYHADLNKKNSLSETPLHIALMENRLGIVRILINKGANVNLYTKEGTSPLMVAASKGYLGIVRILIQHGANCLYRDSNGFTAFDYAHNDEIAKTLKKYCK